MAEQRINIFSDRAVEFNNRTDYCIGTGRMGLALTEEYRKQLELVQKEIGFQYIRGHGLFSDDMGIYREYKDESGAVKSEYCFTYLDRVMDMYLSLNIRPFLELGFMPEKLASGTQTVFYWKGNTTPPRDYDEWCRLVTATLEHLVTRYGDEVFHWPIEVWNEPNLPGFWEHADKDEYFKLFNKTFTAIKKLNSKFRVGGPAICGVMDREWLTAFLDYCKEEGLMPDFITRHHYTSEQPVRNGHYSYIKLVHPDFGLGELHNSRQLIDSYSEFCGLPMHITEFNTSYVPDAPIHDTNMNAAFIAYLLSKLGDDNESYSYWTFGDVFEEAGVPFTPFHGGFGLTANGQIPKPTFWTFSFFKKLKGVCVHRSRNAVVVLKEKDSYCGVVWNDVFSNQMNEKSGETRENDELKMHVSFEGLSKGSYCLMSKTVDEEVCNPLKTWHDLGEPSSLTAYQTELLKQSAAPSLTTERLEVSDTAVAEEFSLKRNAVIYFELYKIPDQSDRGYDYNRAVNQG